MQKKTVSPPVLIWVQKNSIMNFNEEVQLLINKFLNEVYKQMLSKRISKSKLAALVGVSPSYLSQVFQGKKPLTFTTLIKFQRALNIEFEIKAKPGTENTYVKVI